MKKRGIGYFNTWLGCNMKWVALALVVIMGLLPLMVSSSYVIRIATLMLMYIMIASSLNLLTGFMGVMSLGHAAFWGIGAYTGAILSTRLGWGMGSCMLAAIVICGLFGLLLGSPVMKLKGYFMTIVTLGFCEIIRLIELNWSDLTRGSLGINNIPYPNFFGIVFKTPASKFYVILVLAIVTLYIVHAITDSRVGRAIISIREDDLAAASVGVNVVKYKLMVFVISAMIAGVAGVYYAHYILSTRGGHLFEPVPVEAPEAKELKTQAMTDEKLEVVEVLGQTALFTNGRVTQKELPDGLYKYDLREGESIAFAIVEPSVAVNHAGTIITKEPIIFGEEGYIEFGDNSSPNFLGDEMSIEEFLNTDFGQDEDESQTMGGMQL